VLANDGMDTTSDACSALTNTVTGKIVLVDRGTCSFKSKALRVQQAGGIGMLLADNVASSSPPSMGGDANTTATITIGSLSVTMAEGATIKGNIPTTATLHRLAGVELDGSLDSTLVAHEFGHYLHHRLQVCGTRMCGAISEGWGDFLPLMLLARAGETWKRHPFSIYDAGFSTGVFESAARHKRTRSLAVVPAKGEGAAGQPSFPAGNSSGPQRRRIRRRHGELCRWNPGKQFDEVRQKMAGTVVRACCSADARHRDARRIRSSAA
jgi:hypothetical protein